ncbi:DUF5753 domain-containing protein [Actinomadura madurae]|uniref:Scr1 family TA system antitoxin-like transcriptional regulator n=1 Tax=Actinomadura madurae TaxID=1993 RepID=UPI00399B0806
MSDEFKQRVINDFIAELDAARATAAPPSYAAIEQLAEELRQRTQQPPGGPVISLLSSTVNDLFTKQRRRLPRWEMTRSLVIVFREMAARRGLAPDVAIGTVAKWKQRHEKALKLLNCVKRSSQGQAGTSQLQLPRFQRQADGPFDDEDERRAVLLDWARKQQPGVTASGMRVARSLQPCLVLEEWCSRLRIYDPHGIPAHLQTAELADHLQSSSDRYAREAEPTTLQAHGQRMLRRADAVALWIVLEETALRQPPYLDLPSHVWRGQLQHLLDLTNLIQVTLQIRPAGSAHFCARGPIRLLRFRQADVPDVLVLQEWQHGLYPPDSPLVREYYAVLSELAVSAALPDDSTQILRSILKRL